MITIFNTDEFFRDIEGNYFGTYEDVEKEGVNPEDIYLDTDYIEDSLTELSNSIRQFAENNDAELLCLIGNVGTWRGSFPGGAVFEVEDIYNHLAYEGLVIKADSEEDKVLVSIYDHDGTSYFNLAILTKEDLGKKYWQVYEEEGIYGINNTEVLDYIDKNKNVRYVTYNDII